MKGEPENFNLERPSDFSLIYDYYSPLIWKHVFIRTSLREEANDLTAEVFLKTWDYVSSGRKVKQIKSFLYRTADNLIIDWYRSRKKITVLEKDLTEFSDNFAFEAGLEDRVHFAQEVKQLLTLISLLPETDRKILLWRFVDQLEIEEISEILGKSKGAVSVALHRALKSLSKVSENKND